MYNLLFIFVKSIIFYMHIFYVQFSYSIFKKYFQIMWHGCKTLFKKKLIIKNLVHNCTCILFYTTIGNYIVYDWKTNETV